MFLPIEIRVLPTHLYGLPLEFQFLRRIKLKIYLIVKTLLLNNSKLCIFLCYIMITISKATDDIISTLQYIDFVCFDEKEQYTKEVFEHVMKIGSTYIVTDTEFDQIIGYITTIKINKDEITQETKLLLNVTTCELFVELFSIAILPEYRGKHISHMLLDVVDNGSPIYLHVKKSNKIAQKLYEKNNWTHCGIIENHYGPGKDGLVMCKNFL